MADIIEDDGKHFTGLGTCKIHTWKEGTCNRISAQGESCDYSNNCGRPPSPVVWNVDDKKWKNDEGQTVWEAHHILCVESVTRYKLIAAFSAAERRAIDSVYRETEWCINQRQNMIALPRKQEYRDHPEYLSINLPCHCWDHNIVDGYTHEVRQEIHFRIWQKLREVNEKDDLCALAKNVVEEELKSLAKFFRLVLKNRGYRRAGEGWGTKSAWEESQKKNAPQAPAWWYSFSMAKDAVAADRPAKTFGNPKWSARKRYEHKKAQKNMYDA